MFSLSFSTIFVAIAQLFMMGAIGFFLVRRGVIDSTGLRLLSWLSINLTFPLYIFYQIINNFNPSTQAYWWSYPLINAFLCITGLGVAWLIALMINKKKALKEWVAVSAFHNAGYIPLLLVTVLPLGDKAHEFNSFVILTIIGFDMCIWSLGVWLLAYHQKPIINLKNFINPPLISMALAFILVMVGLSGHIPQFVIKPIKIMGDSALAVAMLTIGGNLGLTRFHKIYWKGAGSAVFIKLCVIPLLALLFLKLTHIQNIWGFIFMVQACMPTAITLSVIARYYDNPRQDLLNQTIFISHVLCGLTIPLFLGLYSQ